MIAVTVARRSADLRAVSDGTLAQLVIDVIDRVPFLQSKCATPRQRMLDERITARADTREHGDDIREVREWVWPDARGARVKPVSVPASRPQETTNRQFCC